MPNPELSTTLILGEIILLETVLIIVVSVYFFLKSKKKSLKLKMLLESFLDDEKSRLSHLSMTFKKPEFIDEEKYNTVLNNIINEENLFYKYLINAFYKNDIKSLDPLSTEIQKIVSPFAELLYENEKPESNETINDPVVNIDDAIDELLSDDEDTEINVEHDPAFDLSDPTETATEIPTEELIKTNIENDEIAEIPNDLLKNTSSTTKNESGSVNITEKNEFNNNDNDNEIKI